MSQPHISRVTFYRDFRGPFARIRARSAFNTLVDFTGGFTVSLVQTSLRSPRNWFQARVEVCPDNDPRGFRYTEKILAHTLGSQARRWCYTWPGQTRASSTL